MLCFLIRAIRSCFQSPRSKLFLLPDESNKIMFMDALKQKVLLPVKSNKIMFV